MKKITFQNEDNHYTIAQFKPVQTEGRITIVGYLTGARPGEYLKIEGNWETHPRYGRQFKIEFFEITLPSTIDSIQQYLASGFIKGLGPKTAKALVHHFAEETLNIIEETPQRLLEVSGIGVAKARIITDAWKAHHAARKLLQFLQQSSVQPAWGAPLLKMYGMEAMDTIRANPYCIARDIPHGGFDIADIIGRNMHFPKDDPERIRTCLLHLLHQSMTDGHLFQYETTLLKDASRLLQLETPPIRKNLSALIDSGEVVAEVPAPNDPADVPPPQTSPRIYLRKLHRAETRIAARLRAMLSIPLPAFALETEQITEEILNQLAIQLSEQQLHVVQTILQHRIAVITGGPGTGKTTLIRSIAALLQRTGRKVLLAAPTGRAARRLSEVSCKKAVTIHKLLGYNQTDGGFEKNRDQPLETDAVIVDEASMVDTCLMYHLLEAVPLNARLILVGDRFQLPSVGPGNILSDLIHSQTIMTFELKEIFRQARESAIVMTAHEVRQGNFPDMQQIRKKDGELSEFYFIEQHDPLKVVDIIAELCRSRITKAFGYIDEIQVLTPMHRGEVGTIHLNQVLQHTLNPGSHGIETRNGIFKTGDKVMHLKNNYQKDVFNGDIGVICRMDKSESQLTVDYEGRAVVYAFSELTELSLAYAISVHKSQGSEYEAVIIPVMAQHFPLLQRNLLYTAMTRGKELVILIGTPSALSMALHNDKPRQRLSGLREKLSTSW